MIYNIENIDAIWMRYALVLSNYANLVGEIPIGSVLVYQGLLIGYGYNSSLTSCDPTAHAEILALRMGGRLLNNYRLLGTTLYVTLEPCMMCMGAIIHARIFRLVCGARDRKIGWTVWIKNKLNYNMINHNMIFVFGVLEKECSIQLIDFFNKKRK